MLDVRPYYHVVENILKGLNRQSHVWLLDWNSACTRGTVLSLTVQLMHIERQEVCYALSCGNARVLYRNKIYDITNLEIIVPPELCLFLDTIFYYYDVEWL